MAKYSQGTFVPKNPAKLVGNQRPNFRSSWELTFMTFLDTHPSVIQWASESIRIPYINPLTGKSTVYVPDFLVIYRDRAGAIKREMIEVKPKKETTMEAAKTRRDKAFVILNSAKWMAAMAFCKKNGITFRVVNEDSIYQQRGKKK